MLTVSRLLGSGRVAVSHVDSSSACGAAASGPRGTPEMPSTSRTWSITPRSGSSVLGRAAG